MSRSYPAAPLVGVGVVIFNEKKQVVLVKRGNEPKKGLWAIPGGNVELGEQVSETAIREVKEECNIDIELKDLLGVVDLILKDKDGKVQYHYILIDYLAQYRSGLLKPGSDVLEAEWYFQHQLEKLDIPEVTLKILEKAFKLI
ncbi:NUDIX hydrolase [candidate division KSB1 bacterium]|nr:NUDIX hydrolase [candidate division KSB1 bacterium]MBL7094500.1 NUDIX hydrolase [candidate division KSB1 bacterium]